MRRRRRDDDVHLYFGWDDSVVWFGEPVPYAESGLSEGLVAELEDWTAQMRRLAPDGGPGNTASTPEFRALEARAEQLARSLSREIGPDFAVVVPGAHRSKRFQQDSPSINPAAEAAFRRLREREQQWRREVQRVVRDGGSLHWGSSRDREMP